MPTIDHQPHCYLFIAHAHEAMYPLPITFMPSCWYIPPIQESKIYIYIIYIYMCVCMYVYLYT